MAGILRYVASFKSETGGLKFSGTAGFRKVGTQNGWTVAESSPKEGIGKLVFLEGWTPDVSKSKLTELLPKVSSHQFLGYWFCLEGSDPEMSKAKLVGLPKICLPQKVTAKWYIAKTFFWSPPKSVKIVDDFLAKNLI